MAEEVKITGPQMDWQQVALNGGPPCFYVEGPQYCGRAERWPGHGNPAFHEFVSLEYVTAKPMCPVHRKIEDRGDMDLEIGNDCVACSLNERAELLAILATGTAADGKMDSVTALTALVNERDALLIGVVQLREALEKSARYAHARDGYCSPNFVAFDECKREQCAAARAALAGKEQVSG